MNKYKIIYESGQEKIVDGKNILDVVKKYDLASRGNINSRVEVLENNQ